MIRTNSIHSISSQSSHKDSSTSHPPIQQQQQQQQQVQQPPISNAPKIAQPTGLLQTPTPAHSPTNLRKLPNKFIDCPRDELVVIISRMLSSLIRANDKSASVSSNDFINHQNLTRFHSRSPPSISIYSYLTRLSYHSSLENSVLITSIYYIDLLTSNYPIFAINSLTVHRYLLTSTTVASKALCDSFCSNNYYAKVGGVNLMELNLLEIEFLNKVNWSVVPRINTPHPIPEEISRRKSNSIIVDSSNESRVVLLPDFQNRNNKNYIKLETTPISSASDILDLYYKKMIMLIGGDRQSMTNQIKIGHNDDIIYYIEDEDTNLPDISSNYPVQVHEQTQSVDQQHQQEQEQQQQQDPAVTTTQTSSSRVMIHDDMFSTSSSSSYGSSYASDDYESQSQLQQQETQQNEEDQESQSLQLQNSRKRSIINESNNTDITIKRMNHSSASTTTS